MDQCVASIESLTNRLRTQTWFHELSDQESEGEIDRMVGERPRPAPPRRGVLRARVPVREFDQRINQLRDEVQTRGGLDRDAFAQRVTRFLEEHQRRE